MERKFVFAGYLLLIALFLILVESKSCDETAAMKELKVALHSPSEESLATVVAFGTDSRYYTIVRGWAGYELSGVQSQLGAGNRDYSEQLLQKEEFLTEVIRRIDLE